MRPLRPLLALALLLPVPARAAEAPAQVNAAALLAGARTLADGQPDNHAAAGALDGSLATEWETAREDEANPTVVLELAEPFDLTGAVVTNSQLEADWPGLSAKKLKLEAGKSASGPWTPAAAWPLKKGKAPQRFPLALRGARWLRVTLEGNWGNERYVNLAELELWGRRAKARAVDFTGAWSTSYGEMVLAQKGLRVTGCYGQPDSKAGAYTVEGTVEGPIFFGTWIERASDSESEAEERRGMMAFALTAEGGLAGVWGHSLEDRNTRWDGARLKKSSITCEKPEADLARQLATGRAVLRGIIFDTGKDVIRPESEPVLAALAAAMKGGSARYLIEGHTDDRGGAAFNQGLSERRAASVRRWLAGWGVAEKRLDVQGLGQTRPAMPNDSEAGRAANRRVEVVAR